MPDDPPRRNRGPAAAAANRAALLEAADRLFADQGYLVPLSAIAKAAGVGQGVLYRHFPTRTELALATFADNFEALDRLSAESEGPQTFGRLWGAVVHFTIQSSAFVEMVIHSHAHIPRSLSAERFIDLIAGPLQRAQEAGLADPRWAPDDIVLVLHMLHGVVIASRADDTSDVADNVRRALGLIDPGLVPTSGEPAAR